MGTIRAGASGATAGLDTAGSLVPSGPPIHRHHCWRRVVGGVIWLAVVVYVLWLATRIVRAVEKVADRYQGRP